MRRAAGSVLRAALPSRSCALPARGPARAAAIRPFSCSSPTPFFFRKPVKSTDELVREMMRAQKDDRPDVLAKLYPAFVDAAHDSSSSSSSRPPISYVAWQDMMKFAARTGKFRLALRMFNDGTARFGFKHSRLDHQILLMAMCRVGRMNKAVEWLESMPATYGLAPGVSEWNAAVQGYRRAKDLEGMRAVTERMRAHGVEPDVVTYNKLIAALFEHGHLDGVRAAVVEMRACGVEPDLWTEQSLLDGFLDAGELASAREVHRRLSLVVQSAVQAKGKQPAADIDTAVLNALIKFETLQHGFDAGLRLAGEYRAVATLNARTLNTLIQHGVSEIETATDGVALIERLEDVVGVDADRHAWATVISALAKRPGGLDEATRAYQIARDRSIQPDSSMIHPLLSALLLPSPSPAAFEAAKELFDDYSSSAKTYATAPDAGVYGTLLRACADPDHPDLQWSRTLIGEMKARGVRLDGATAAWHITALMRAAGSFEEAFAAYDEMRALDPSVLDRAAYNAILSAFTSLVFDAASPTPAPAPLIMEFLADMRTSGHPPDSRTYAQLLTYYSRAASASPATIAHLHSLIKLDVHLDPDTALFNALMGAYSRTGAYNAAYRIWDGMLLGGSGAGSAGVDPTSISTLLDTAAHDGSPDAQRRAERVWADLESGRIRVRRNGNNWDAWVEALGRWGRMDEAERIVFDEMRPGSEVVAHEGTIRALLKFAMRDSEEAQVRVARRVKEERPDLWGAVEKLAQRRRWSSEEEKAARRGGSGEKAAGFFSTSTAPPEHSK